MSDRGDATTGGPGGDVSGPGDDEGDHVGDTDAGEDDDGWRFSIDEVGPEAETAARPRIEPGDPSLENALFVLLGVLLTLFVLSRLVVG